jgi:hypothetical protein
MFLCGIHDPMGRALRSQTHVAKKITTRLHLDKLSILVQFPDVVAQDLFPGPWKAWVLLTNEFGDCCEGRPAALLQTDHSTCVEALTTSVSITASGCHHLGGRQLLC